MRDVQRTDNCAAGHLPQLPSRAHGTPTSQGTSPSNEIDDAIGITMTAPTPLPGGCEFCSATRQLIRGTAGGLIVKVHHEKACKRPRRNPPQPKAGRR